MKAPEMIVGLVPGDGRLGRYLILAPEEASTSIFELEYCRLVKRKDDFMDDLHENFLAVRLDFVSFDVDSRVQRLEVVGQQDPTSVEFVGLTDYYIQGYVGFITLGDGELSQVVNLLN